jgi:DNA ligase D
MKTHDIEGIVITHPERVLYPEDGITKRDVADYYAAVMDWFLPGVAGRPVSVLRSPEGIGQAGFFQKHPFPGLKHVSHIRLKEESGAMDYYLCPCDAKSIIELVQFGAIEFHPWSAKAETLDQADYLVFDLDPAPGIPWPDVVAAARLIRKQLDDVMLESLVRASGGKGLHVVVPLHPPGCWDDARRFAQAFARHLASTHPHTFVAKASKQERSGRIFIDYLRNSRGATSIASYSLRARIGAPVALPMHWDELGKSQSGHDFDIRSARRRLARLRRDPWQAFGTMRQDLHHALEVFAPIEDVR